MRIKSLSIQVIFTFMMLTLIMCIPKEQSSDDAAIALFLLSSEAVNSEGLNCKLQEQSTITQGSPTTTQVNATSTRCWMLVSLERSGIQLGSNEKDWDLRFKRFVIGTNSGTSGSEKGAACDTGLTDFAVISVANKAACNTESNFKIDSIQSQDGAGFGNVNDSANTALFNWYNYNNTTLTAKANVYIVRGSNGSSLFKLQMLDYYSSAGTSGYPQFRWAKL